MYEFGNFSKKRIDSCHPYLQKILNLAIKRTVVDFGISEGYRSLERQRELFSQGRTKIDGESRRGKHNKIPSEAADIYIWTSNKKYRGKVSYDPAHLAYVAGVITACAMELKERGEINCDIRWGGDWNNNGIIDFDQSFDDLPHIEIVNIK